MVVERAGHWTYVCVWHTTVNVGTVTEGFGPRLELDVGLESDRRFQLRHRCGVGLTRRYRRFASPSSWTTRHAGGQGDQWRAVCPEGCTSHDEDVDRSIVAHLQNGATCRDPRDDAEAHGAVAYW